MRHRFAAIAPVLALTGLFVVPVATAVPAQSGRVDCDIKFTMSGWSAFYKTASGVGTIKCSNGESAKVKLDAKGGGPTVGRTVIDKGRGRFSGVDSISDLFGAYVSAEAGAGAVKAANVNLMSKGPVSLAFSGIGRGWELGIAFGRISIDKS